MNVYDVIALTIHSNEDVISNRTTMQKLVYFNSIMIKGVKVRPYAHHFYGPFSGEVAVALEEMSAFSYLNEIRHSGFYESYTYELTTKGKEYAKIVSEQYPDEFKKITDIVTTCKDFCELKANPVSYAAKAHYVLVNTEECRTGQYTIDDVSRAAANFDWNISKDDVEKGISLLQKLNLVSVS